jgi:hypothetical protein
MANTLDFPDQRTLMSHTRLSKDTNTLHQGSSTFQIVRATLTVSMMPAGHKAILRHLEL